MERGGGGVKRGGGGRNALAERGSREGVVAISFETRTHVCAHTQTHGQRINWRKMQQPLPGLAVGQPPR